MSFGRRLKSLEDLTFSLADTAYTVFSNAMKSEVRPVRVISSDGFSEIELPLNDLKACLPQAIAQSYKSSWPMSKPTQAHIWKYIAQLEADGYKDDVIDFRETCKHTHLGDDGTILKAEDSINVSPESLAKIASALVTVSSQFTDRYSADYTAALQTYFGSVRENAHDHQPTPQTLEAA